MANQVDLLPANLQNTLHQIVDRVNNASGGIRVILLSTAEGVPLGRVYASSTSRNSSTTTSDTSSSTSPSPSQPQPLNEDVLSNIESIWAPASKQFPLLDMGKEAKTVTAIYDHGTILHVYQAPVVVTILVGQHANLGAVRSTGIPLLKEVLEPLCTTLLNSLAPAEDTDPSYPQQGYYQ